MNVVIVHGANDSEESAFEGGRENTRHWFNWLIKELENESIKVSGGLYPKDWEPDYKEWKSLFERNEINEGTILIGHSLGCGFILRWMAENKRKVKKVILVAPYVLDSPELPGLKDMVNFEFDSSLNELWGELVIFSSEDDDEFILKSVKEINNKLNSKHLSFKDKGHFTKGDLGKEEFPELLEEILKI
jgi:predicted alpha/beta hydrolase family esterase